jgi:hypothetical protein
VHTRARRLPHDKDASRCSGSQDRARTEWKVPFAHAAIAYGHQQLVKRRIS